MSVQARELAGTFAPYCRNKFGMREDAWYIDPGVQGTAERTGTLRNRRAERGQQRPRHPGQHQRDQGGY